ncbi:hypothetical protein BEST7613_4402 [Synechocystis sp. PCC 6803]|nr:hypothetical protein BEST7613_4402 [Synechocystis sp. PCC 6803] [Bacillus subtilis BEST7613]
MHRAFPEIAYSQAKIQRMKTDKWFYELFLSQPGMMAELVPGIEPEWEFVYSAPVVKEKEFRLDGVFMPVSEDPLVPIIFAEAQMQADEQFYGRYFAQLFVYLYQYRVSRDWRGLMILQSREQRLGNDLPYRDLLAQRVTRLYLSDLRTGEASSPNLALLQLLVADKNKTLELSKGLLRSAPTDNEFQRRLSLIETILANKFPDLTKEIIMQMLDLKQMDITKSLFYQEIIQEGLEEGRQRGLEEGRQEGIQEGLEEGRQEGEANLIVRLLTRRLGELSNEQIGQIRELAVPQLEELGEALLDFTTMADLEQFLANLY